MIPTIIMLKNYEKLEKTEIDFVSHFDFPGIQGCIAAVIMWSDLKSLSYDCSQNHMIYIVTNWHKSEQAHPDIFKYPICMPNYQ